MELKENMGLADFSVLWKGESSAGWSRRRLVEKNAARGIKELRLGIYSTLRERPKWKSQPKRRGGVIRMRHITSVAVIAVVAIVSSAVVVRAEQPQVSLNPDRILKGTTPTITITLDKSIPDQKEIKSVRVGGQTVAVQEPDAEGKLSVPLPNLDIVGRADVDVIGKDNKSVAVAQLTYVESSEAASNIVVGPSSKELALLVVYILLIVLLPSICTIYDIRKSYGERRYVFQSLLLPRQATIDDVGALLAKMDQGPTGFVGLTRGLLALTLVLAVALAAFYLIVFAPSKVPDIAEKLLMLLAGTFTAITGFYFGSKVATEAQQKQAPVPKEEVQTSSPPKILKVEQGSGARSTELTVTGEGFGSGKGVVTVEDKDGTVTDWKDQQIKITIPAGVKGDVKVVVTNDKGKSSDPKQTTIV